MHNICTTEGSNSRYIMHSYGNGICDCPLWTITNLRTGEVIHAGKRKHVVEMWNTRYNYSRSRSYNNG